MVGALFFLMICIAFVLENMLFVYKYRNKIKMIYKNCFQKQKNVPNNITFIDEIDEWYSKEKIIVLHGCSGGGV